jgi:peptidoglycan hydrolase-like protein with peptidoglycan-binding domain
MTFFTRLSIVALAASVAAVPARDVQANEVGAAIVGGAIGFMLNDAMRRNQQQRQRVVRRSPNPGVTSAQRTANAEVQTALNYFGYNAGTVDGSIGPRSRAAISEYQATMGFTATGRLDDYQRGFLTTSYQRALHGAGDPRYQQVMAQQGPRGLLRTFRNEQLGLPAPGTQQAVAPPQVVAPQPPVAPATQPPAGVQTPAPVIPSFPGGGVTAAARSVNQHCNEVQILTTTNGGYVTAATMTNPTFAMNEQFCLARAYATSEANSIVASFDGVSFDQVQQQCDGLAQAIGPAAEGLADRGIEETRTNISAILDGSGQTAEQLTMAGRICLGVGYRTDEPKVALASALMLVSVGRDAYGEIVGHHLREGFGIAASAQAGRTWIGFALDALDRGDDPAFLPAESGVRSSVLRAALNGGGAPATTVPVGAPAAPTLPIFSVTGGN